MNCDEFMQWISDGVDGRLERNLRRQFFKHLKTCKNCQREFELELITKEALTRRLLPAEASTALTDRVVSALRSEAAARSFGPRLHKAFASRALRYSIAVGLAVVLVLIGVSVVDHRPSFHGDVLANTERNYDAMREGSLKPQVVVYEPEKVQQYFDDGASFRVMVPAVGECAYIAGLLSRLNSIQEAHIFFKIDDETYLYVYEVPANAVLNRRMFQLPTEAERALAEGKWFVKRTKDRTFMLWLSENTLCAAISNMDEDSMIEALAASDPPGW